LGYLTEYTYTPFVDRIASHLTALDLITPTATNTLLDGLLSPYIDN